MKKLHEFTVNKEQEVDEAIVSKDEKGQEITTITKVKKPVPQKFFLAKPTRSLYDEADLFYAVKLSEGIKAGLLTKPLLAKRYANDGGSMSEPEKQTYANLYVNLFEKQSEYQKFISEKPETERTAEDKAKISEILKDLTNLRQQIQEFELSQSSLFDQTAESRARNKTILWWVLFLCHKVEGDKELPYFGEGDYDSRLAKYDEIEEIEDQFVTDTVSKFLYYVSFWYMGKASNPEDFAMLDKLQEENK
jgi:hypothetical protein